MEACHMRRRIHACMYDSYMEACFVYGGMPYEEEDTCMYVRLESYMEACHMRRRIHACMYDLYVHHTPGREPEGQGQEQELLPLLLLLLRCARERATTQARP
jgi:hypothetical protein